MALRKQPVRRIQNGLALCLLFFIVQRPHAAPGARAFRAQHGGDWTTENLLELAHGRRILVAEMDN
jgi:hypothetical protein